jgi:hypothetical protein
LKANDKEVHMLQELVNQAIEIRMAGFEGEKIKGKVLRVDDSWIEIATKKNIELVNIVAIKKIITRSE